MTKKLRKPIDILKEMVEVQGRNGSWNYDPYMHGLYNGLEFAFSIMEKREPRFRSAPDKWLFDRGIKRTFPEGELGVSEL